MFPSLTQKTYIDLRKHQHVLKIINLHSITINLCRITHGTRLISAGWSTKHAIQHVTQLLPFRSPWATRAIGCGSSRTVCTTLFVSTIASFCWKLTFISYFARVDAGLGKCLLFRWKESWGPGPRVCLGAAAHLAEKKRPDPLLYFPAIYLHVFRKSRSLGKCRTECLRVLCWWSRWDSMPVNDLDILCINLGKLHVPHVRGGRGPQIL